MNIPPVQNNVVQSPIVVALGVVCFVFALIEIAIEVLFPPVRRERHPWRQRAFQFPTRRVNTMTPMMPQLPPPVLVEPENDVGLENIELEDLERQSSPEEIV